MNETYDEDYFENGVIFQKSGYQNFRWIPELTIPMCARLSEKLAIKDEDTILDFGCAKGYVVKGFRLIGKQAWGFDVSNYAINNCDRDVAQYVSTELTLQNNIKYDWIIAKDVLEHISYNEIDNLLNKIYNSCNKLFCCLPLGINDKYVIESYELDITHVIRKPLDWWGNKFKDNGFAVEYSGYSFDILKSNYSSFKNGNGFFILNTLKGN